MMSSEIIQSVYIFQLNFWGLILEVVGFLIMLIAMQRLKWRQGGFDGGNPVDNSGKAVNEILGVPHVWLERSGIFLIICGLIMQAIGVWLSNPF